MGTQSKIRLFGIISISSISFIGGFSSVFAENYTFGVAPQQAANKTTKLYTPIMKRLSKIPDIISGYEPLQLFRVLKSSFP